MPSSSSLYRLMCCLFTGAGSRSINGRKKPCTEVTYFQELFHCIQWGSSARKIWGLCLRVLVVDSHTGFGFGCEDKVVLLYRFLSIFGRWSVPELPGGGCHCLKLCSLTLEARGHFSKATAYRSDKEHTHFSVYIYSLVCALWAYLCHGWNDISMNFVSLSWCL